MTADRTPDETTPLPLPPEDAPTTPMPTAATSNPSASNSAAGAPRSSAPKVWSAAGTADAPATAPGAHWRDAEESAPARSAYSGASSPAPAASGAPAGSAASAGQSPTGHSPAAAGGEQKVWTAADALEGAQSAPSGGVRVGQLVWACIVLLTGVFLITMAFFDVINVPVVLISLVGVLGLSLIGAALIVGKEPSTKRDRP